MKKNYLIITLFILVAGLNCKKDIIISDNNTPKLPSETQSGKNTFGCKVDGVIWIANGSLSIQRLSADYQDGIFIISANNTNNNSFIYMNVDSLYKIEILLLYDGPRWEESAGYSLNTEEYFIDSNHTAFINIKKLDTINRIVAGTFEFDAVNDSAKIVKITDGRFDVKY